MNKNLAVTLNSICEKIYRFIKSECDFVLIALDLYMLICLYLLFVCLKGFFN